MTYDLRVTLQKNKIVNKDNLPINLLFSSYNYLKKKMTAWLNFPLEKMFCFYDLFIFKTVH